MAKAAAAKGESHPATGEVRGKPGSDALKPLAERLSQVNDESTGASASEPLAGGMPEVRDPEPVAAGSGEAPGPVPEGTAAPGQDARSAQGGPEALSAGAGSSGVQPPFGTSDSPAPALTLCINVNLTLDLAGPGGKGIRSAESVIEYVSKLRSAAARVLATEISE